jgi:hypothetical protein
MICTTIHLNASSSPSAALVFSSYLKVDILDPVSSVYRGYYLNLVLRLTMYRYSI